MVGIIAGCLEPFELEIESIVYSILGVGGAVLRRTHGQVGSHVPEHHWMGELLTVMEYLIATETVGAVPNEAHGHLEGVL